MTAQELEGTRETVKVSVVVATYNSPPQLDDLMASLDAQTMDKTEFEVVFVDDGSTDGTLERLERIAGERSNVSVHRIPNSGWPGRPRNVGTRAARGEYVFFSDHDDYVFPEALERMYRFAAGAGLDVLHPKEVVKGWSSPGWRSWLVQESRVAKLDQDVLQCITPHKLYRRAFLLEKNVWFPEGRVRLEDFSLNGQAWVRTDSIGVMADYPCYRWVIYEDNSHKQSYDFEVYWSSFRASLEPILEELPEGEKRDALLVRWYRSRILERLAAPFHGYDEEYREQLVGKVTELLPLFPPHLDAYLNPPDRARSMLLRNGDVDSLVELSRLDSGITLSPRRLATEWVDGRLQLSVNLLTVDRDGRPVEVEQADDGRVLRRVPEALRAGTGPEAWDLTDTLAQASAEVVVRSRADSVDWILESESSVEVLTVDGVETFRFRVSTVIDPGAAAMGRPLADDCYDIFCRVVGLGFTRTHRITARRRDESGALVDGRAVVVYRTRAGHLAMDLSNTFRALPAMARPEPRLTHGLRRSRIELPGVHVSGQTAEPGSVLVGEQAFPAVLTGRAGKADITVDRLLQGEGEVRTDFFGRVTNHPLFAIEAGDQPGAAPSRASTGIARKLGEWRGRDGRS